MTRLPSTLAGALRRHSGKSYFLGKDNLKGGCLNIPGFVDLQVNGYLGVDFSNAALREEDFVYACTELVKNGTAAFLPTVITSSAEVFERNLRLIARNIKRPEFKGRLPGIHVEGPFVSREPGAVGAHNPEWTREPDLKFFDRMMEWSEGLIRLMTVAAEAPGTAELIRHASAKGVTVSLGHHLATGADLERAVAAKARLLTHLGNGLPNLLPRHPNPIWEGIANEDLTAMLISDGHHLPNSVLKTIIRAKGVAKCLVTSDASPLAGMLPGKYEALGNPVVLEENGRLHNPEKNCLVGSSATMLPCMNHLASLNFLNLYDLLQLGYFNPLQVIGLGPNALPAEEKVHFNGKKNRFELCD